MPASFLTASTWIPFSLDVCGVSSSLDNRAMLALIPVISVFIADKLALTTGSITVIPISVSSMPVTTATFALSSVVAFLISTAPISMSATLNCIWLPDTVVFSAPSASILRLPYESLGSLAISGNPLGCENDPVLL